MSVARTGVFSNSNGESFTFAGIPPKLFSEMRIAQEKRWEKEGKPLPIVPTYETAADEIIEWDKAAVMKDGSEDEKQAWADYENNWIAFNEEYNLRRAKIIALYLQDDPMKDTAWITEMEIAGIEIPEKEHDIKYLYMNTKILVGIFEDVENDFIRLLVFLQALSGAISREVAEAFEATFRSVVERDTNKRVSEIAPPIRKMGSK